MPMRIVNLKGGSGPAPAPSGGASDSGLYKFLEAPKLNIVNPASDKFVEVWEDGNKSKPRPDSITVMIWGPGAWQTHVTTTLNRPPDCGIAFGIVTLKGDDIPEKLYYFRGNHQVTYPYTYEKSRTFGFNSSPSRDDGWLLPNPTGNKAFNQTDFIAPDAVNHHWGTWDAIYNGGNGHYWRRLGSDTMDSPGSNGSVFGAGKTSTGEYPASCGGPGTGSSRGPKAKGIGLDILKPLGGLRPHAVELEPAQADIKVNGGGGGFEFVLPTGSFGMARGAPYTPDTSVVRVAGGPEPINRFDTSTRNYFVSMYVLFEYAK